jgi:hypothetical protein
MQKIKKFKEVNKEYLESTEELTEDQRYGMYIENCIS